MATPATVVGVRTWKLDPAHSTAEFSAKHMMITTVKGRFKQLQGTIVASEVDPDASSVQVEIDASSLDTGSDQRDQHLRSADFLNVEEHPTITFRSKRVEGAHADPGDSFKVVGDLTIRGTTREVVLDATFEGSGKDPWGGERASFSADAEVDRREWGLAWNQALETGGVLVSNKIKIHLDVQAVLQEG